MNKDRRAKARAVAGLLVISLLLSLIPFVGLSAQATELFFSEYIEGSSFNKALEIYNGTGAAVDLSTYTIELYSNGASSPSQTTALSGTLADGDVFVIANPSADAAILAIADATSGSVVNFNGDDAVVLKNGGTVIDVIGQVGVDPGSYWGGGDVTTQNHTLRRKDTVEAGDTDGSDPFDPTVEWDSYAQDAFDGLGCHGPGCNVPQPGQPLPLIEGFDDCTLAGWEIISVDSDTAHTWSCSSQYSNIEANGYGDSAPADEWLITPPLDLDAQENDTLTFRSYTNYTDVNYPQLHVKYSTDYDGGGDPTIATWTELSGITFSPEGSGSWTDSGDVDLSGITGTKVYIAFHYVSSGTGGGSAATWRLDAINIFEQVFDSGWVINEIHADPAGDLSGDANGDGTRDSGQDEFLEIVNNTGADVDVSNWTLSDAVGVRHTFPAGTVVPASCSIVVFGGGSPTGSFGGSLVQTASSGSLGLNNGGDSVTLFGTSKLADYTYGGEGGDNQSLTRDPDVTGPDPLVKHTTATGSGGALFSPGTMVDGTGFIGCQPVKIHDIQGSGLASPVVDSVVTIEGIVVGDFQNNGQPDNGDLRGFYVQEEDADADADALTSEGVFVYDGSSPAVDVTIGELVRVRGKVAEYNELTEITYVSEVTVLSSGNVLPTPATVTLPVSAVADLEAYEGMSVILPQELYISEYYNFDRYNEIVLTTERQFQPTAIYEPGSAEAAQLADANERSRITLDDGRTSQNPDPALHPNGAEFTLSNLFRGGDVLQNVTGVLDYYQRYKIQPTQGADYTPMNPRSQQPDDVGGFLKVASFNVLNYFTTLDDGVNDICGPAGDQECRGADTAEEFTRQRAKIIAALIAIDADVVGLIEIENHPGDVPTADLVAGLNDVLGPGTYEYIATGAIGTDAIRQAFIYKPATVSLVGDYAVLDDPAFTDPRGYGEQKSRPALGQTFMGNTTGGVFTVVVNHLKSKGTPCDDPMDDDPEQGSCNLTRTLGAQALVNWLATDPTGSGDADFLIIGDLNAYDKEDPIDALLAGGYTDLVHQFQGEYAYSYVFDGQLGYLDHALAGTDLVDEVTGTTVWHINADEPDLIDYDTSFKKDAQDALYEPDAFRSSDHDPVVVGLGVCDDDVAPTVDVLVTPDTLWPVNHKYVDVVATVTATDNFDPNPTVTLSLVTSSQPEDGRGAGNTTEDIVVVDDFTFQFRAERSGEEGNRVYEITYEVTDACGNSTMASAMVTVPHDQGKKNK